MFPIPRTWVATLALSSIAAAAGAAPRIVSCTAQVQSHKRGVCANALSGPDFKVLAPGVSWYYNWSPNPLAKPTGVKMEFLPMVWNDDPGSLTSLESYLNAGNRPRAVLALNEPNLKGQAYMTPTASAALYDKVREIADKANLPVVGPQMALGSATGESITAWDPIQQANVTYTFMVPFLNSFMFYEGLLHATATVAHVYGNLGELTWCTDLLHKTYSKPVWVTEYAGWKEPDDASALKYLVQSTDYLERTPWVKGYAWFKERLSDNPRLSLLAPESGVLTPMGKMYVNMPVHDADLYYRIPGRLQAERYVAMDKAEPVPTTDTDGLLDLTTTDAGATLDYNVQVDTAGQYRFGFRLAGAQGAVQVSSGGTVLGTATPSVATGWRGCATTVTLPAGTQTLRLQFAAKGQAINWISFNKV